MSYSDQDNFFAQAYRTGTDSWTTTPFSRHARELLLYVPKGSTILDIGAGRGRTLFELVSLGFKVIGLEKNPDLVARGNAEVKAKGKEKEARFLHGDALNIAFTDQSFDALVDIGLMHHLKTGDHVQYVAELARVLKQGGILFLITLSKMTKNYLSWHPLESTTADFEREGLRYHFFSDEEINTLFEKDFSIIHREYDTPHGADDAVFAVVVLRKK